MSVRQGFAPSPAERTDSIQQMPRTTPPRKDKNNVPRLKRELPAAPKKEAERIAKVVADHVDLGRLLAIAQSAPALPDCLPPICPAPAAAADVARPAIGARQCSWKHAVERHPARFDGAPPLRSASSVRGGAALPRRAGSPAPRSGGSDLRAGRAGSGRGWV